MILIIFLSFLSCAEPARILAVAPIPSYSHQLFFRPIWMELAKRGHEITLLTTDLIPSPPKNIRQIDWSSAYHVRHVKYNLTRVAQENEYNLPKLLQVYVKVYDDILHEEMSHPEVQELLTNPNTKFDLLIAEFHLPAVFGFSHHFKCPSIGITSGEISSLHHDWLGNPIHPALYPEVFLPFDGKQKFIQRIISLGISLYLKYFQFFNSHDPILKEYFGKDVPKAKKLTQNVSMVFLNSHPVFSSRPLGPGFVMIGGGTHLAPLKPLPEDLKTFLDKANEGVIYFSLGTNVRSGHLNANLLNVIVKTFKDLPYKILWKFEVDVAQVSENVKIVKWTPQQDVLRHKNIKLFITQCGMQSIEEAIVSRVPMILMPFVSDQKINARRLSNREIGIYIDYKTTTKEKLHSSIQEAINNPKYKRNIESMATLLQDEPMTGVQKAVWWTEYVLRHKGAKHFWTHNHDLPWYEYLYLDIIAFFLTIIFGLCWLTLKSIRFFYRRLFVTIDINKKNA